MDSGIHSLPFSDLKGNETNIIHLSNERRALKAQTGRSCFQDHLALETERDFRIILRLENAPCLICPVRFMAFRVHSATWSK